MAAGFEWFLFGWGSGSAMDVKEFFGGIADRLYLIGVGPIGDIDESAVVIFPIETTRQILVAPLEPGRPNQSGMGIGLLGVVAEGDSSFFL